MYRVELKGETCVRKRKSIKMFLMYRVELKVVALKLLVRKFKFLMYRVELKVAVC